jgi:hypothetical protein
MKEKDLVSVLTNYIKVQYPRLIYRIDYATDMKLSIGQAMKMKRTQMKERGYPDLWVSLPKGRYHGLYLELKVTTPYKKDGTLKKNEHLEEQQEMHDRLNQLGYKATFGVGFDECKEILDNYIKRGI